MKRIVQGFIMLQIIAFCILLIMRPAGASTFISDDNRSNAHHHEQTVISPINLIHFTVGENNQKPATRLVYSLLKHVKGEFLEKSTAIIFSQNQSLTQLFRESISIVPEFSKPDIVFPFNYHW